MPSFKLVRTPEGYCLENVKNRKNLRTHLDNPFPAVSEEVALLLQKDIENSPEVSASFVYSALSSIIELKRQRQVLENKANPAIQWDTAYRLDEDRSIRVNQERVIEKLTRLLGETWENLAPNEAHSLEEMKSEKVAFVPDFIVRYFDTQIKEFNQLQLYCIDLLNQYYNGMNYSLSVLWMIGKISDKDLIEGGLILGYLKENLSEATFTHEEVREIRLDEHKLKALRYFLMNHKDFEKTL